MNLVRTVRSLPARLLHPLRRRTALGQLRHRRPPRSVLFVCHGNICRSPYAAATFALRLARQSREDVAVDSAGFIGPGRPSPENALEVAARRGVDLSAHRSQLVTPRHWAGTDLVVVMEPGQRLQLETLFGREGRAVLVLGDLDPDPVTGRSIADPVEQPESAFEDSYARIDRCVDTLVGALFASTRASRAPSL